MNYNKKPLKILYLAFLMTLSQVIFAKNMVHELKGSVLINDQPAEINQSLAANYKIQTLHDGFIKVIFEESANSIKKNSVFVLPKNTDESLGNLVKGSLIGAFKKGGERKLKISHGILSVRGTGFAVESGHDHSAVCLCYGEIDLDTDQEQISLSTENTKYHLVVHIDPAGDVYLLDLNSCKFDHWSVNNIELEKLLNNSSPFKKGLTQFL
ncbi:hypothetical protein VI34_03650 [Methylophilales bacterium MBRSG12]|uniref:FecR protein domain-containing protein n=1 Tax=Methylophilales bacterium MBRS-H7 TaxID=1623450 RepID=A0A0H4J1C6_9PROT|nr:hypothetical protein UZ34_06675 [Methylophilales bacterium MBRSF5]AKO65825.1 hypothetical protein VI33_03650 [Methylophilales bacterium MBRS-H7]AKO67145.1 hypothetical protein VI34_03650 [Methylophilales bacterium MBRSG12]